MKDIESHSPLLVAFVMLTTALPASAAAEAEALASRICPVCPTTDGGPPHMPYLMIMMVFLAVLVVAIGALAIRASNQVAELKGQLNALKNTQVGVRQ